MSKKDLSTGSYIIYPSLSLLICPFNSFHNPLQLRIKFRTGGFNIKNLQQEIISFNKKRDWQGNKDARNLAISINLEASELLEHFQWQNAEQAIAHNKEDIAEEAADVLIYLLQLADVLEIDLAEEARKKIAKN